MIGLFGIVRNFHEYLSGEKKLPINRQNNPLIAKQPKTSREIKVQDMIIKIRINDINISYKNVV